MWQGYMLMNPEQRKGQALLNTLWTTGLHDLSNKVDSAFPSIFYSDEHLNEAIGMVCVELTKGN